MSTKEHPKTKLAAVVGPTATGKSALAVEIALAFSGEVINADSRLFYRGFDIGTAKPTQEERRGVPHHLVDGLGPDETFSLAGFLDAARAAELDITGRGKLPVLVGGTGQYVWGLLEGWEAPRVPPDPVLRRALEHEAREKGVEALFARLEQASPASAASVDRRNPRRVIRALERAAAGPGAASRPKKAAAPPFDALVIGLTLPRHELYARIDRRIDAMAAAGWADEVRRLLASGVSRDCPVMSSIGYRGMAAYVSGEISLEEAIAAARKDTRRLVRHQYNWFKLSDPRILWLEGGEGAEEQAAHVIRAWLSRP